MAAPSESRRSGDPPSRRGSVFAPHDRWSALGPGVLVVVVALLTFLPSVRNEITGWDDGAYITTNPNMVGLDGLIRIWTSRESDQYYPLTFTSYWLEYQVWGRNPHGYHASNVVLHVGNSLLLLLLLRGLGMKRWPACACALLFAVHPVQVMSTAWIPGRKNLLSGLFVVLSGVAWIRFRHSGLIRWYLASIMAFAAGLLSKSAVLMLPIVLATVDRMIFGIRWRCVITRVAPLLALATASALVTVLFEQKFLFQPPDLIARALIAATAVWFYARTLLLPVNLSPIYPLWEVAPVEPNWWLPVVGIAVVGFLVWRVRRRHPAVALGTVAFVAFALPSLGLVPFGNMAVTYVSDHYLYLASIGPIAVVMLGVQRLRETYRIKAAVAGTLAALIVAYSIGSVRYSNVFRDAKSMWTYTIKRNPACYPAHAGLGYHYASLGEWDRAAHYYAQAVDIMPELAEAHVALGSALVRGGEIERAGVSYDRALKLSPDNSDATYGLAVVAQRTENVDRAVELYEDTLFVDPWHCRARLGLGALLLQRGRLLEATQHCERAVQDCPREPLAYLGLAACRRRERRFSEAIDVLRGGLQVDPNDIRLLNFLARILATSPDDTSRDGEEATELAERACVLSEYRKHHALDTLAAALAESGRFAEAERTALEAAELARAAGMPAAADAMRRRASQYARGEPLREVAVGEDVR